MVWFKDLVLLLKQSRQTSFKCNYTLYCVFWRYSIYNCKNCKYVVSNSLGNALKLNICWTVLYAEWNIHKIKFCLSCVFINRQILLSKMPTRLRLQNKRRITCLHVINTDDITCRCQHSYMQGMIHGVAEIVQSLICTVYLQIMIDKCFPFLTRTGTLFYYSAPVCTCTNIVFN